jgi:hypothetical protein
VAAADIPEKVVIDVMVNEYGPAELPHGKIVRTLTQGIGESHMAAVFHREAATMCQGCHHNSPASLKPPPCASCHGKPFSDYADGRPGLKGAYHGQCIDCHQQMGLAKPAANDCTACHPKRKPLTAQRANPQ